MSMRSRVERYLAMRRSLGFKLRGEGRMLLEFADRLDSAGQATITIPAAVAWASEPSNATAAHRQRRLAVIRGFAGYLAARNTRSRPSARTAGGRDIPPVLGAQVPGMIRRVS
jgi:hypothetical protein